MSLADWWEYSLWGAKRNGRNDGRINIPTKTQVEHSAYERQYAMRASKEIRHIATDWEKADQSLKGNYVVALRQYIDALKSAKKEVSEAEAMLIKQREAQKTLNDASHNPHLSKTKYWAIILLIAVGEIPLTAKAFALMGENNMLTYVFALVLCVSVPACAHFAGLIMKEKFNWKNLGFLVADLAAFGMVLYVVSWVREKYFQAEGQQLLEGVQMDPHMISLVFFAIQLFIFLVAATASYFAHDSHPDRHKAIRDAKTTAIDLSKEAGEAKEAENHLKMAVSQLTAAEAQRQKRHSSYRTMAEEVVEKSKMMIEAYRGANVRTRGDGDIASFNAYPEITLPACLLELDVECGFTVPEATPVHCPKCGGSNPFNLAHCKNCGNTI